LIDPQTSAVLKPLYDAETTVGHLTFGDGGATTIVWTRMSGAGGALMGAAILSDGDVLLLIIDPASRQATERPVHPVRRGLRKPCPRRVRGGQTR
jgi:hypothetical protein